jgi:hypothetical protein
MNAFWPLFFAIALGIPAASGVVRVLHLIFG